MELTPTKNPTHMDEQCWKPPVFLCLFWRCKNVMLSEGCLVVPLSFQQQKPLWVTRGCLRKDAARPRIFQNSPSLQNGLEGNVIPEICFWKVTPIFSPPIKIHTEPKRPRGESPIKLPDLRKKNHGGSNGSLRQFIILSDKFPSLIARTVHDVRVYIYVYTYTHVFSDT